MNGERDQMHGKDAAEEGQEPASAHLDALAKIVTSRRGRQALEILREEIDRAGGRDNQSSSGKPSFPDAKSVAGMSGDTSSARG